VAAVPPVVLVPALLEGCAEADWLLISGEVPVVEALGGLLGEVPPLCVQVSAIFETSLTANELALTPAEA
jgi:hypothetical protein